MIMYIGYLDDMDQGCLMLHEVALSAGHWFTFSLPTLDVPFS